ncbi:nitrate reductase associated protein [Dyadobacter sp. CY261]|uniref:nitrate reductase associated protein n=1 Tax=Dyadobacter sp. CY261 TaxID=2907203 RepID=UPI001F2058E4|nr:nitrate reductase associated protein [Dyadobacter sp. CY261]MCF0073881.1 nitrate reductase associated protein [Dyadobacter sp. CY261]
MTPTPTITTRFFAFESDFVDSLRCIPMIVRYKLDTCRVKLQLSDWAKFDYYEKDLLAEHSCHKVEEIDAYAALVNGLVWKYTSTIPSLLKTLDPSWVQPQVPMEVREKVQEWDLPVISIGQWRQLDVLERFALVKLSRSGHEGRNFPRAMAEFGLAIAG